MKVRKLKIQCIDEIGQTATFTVDENGKQNSPSFDSLYALSEWSLKPCNYAFRVQFVHSNFNNNI